MSVCRKKLGGVGRKSTLASSALHLAGERNIALHEALVRLRESNKTYSVILKEGSD
jgi:hypothetical protein